MRLEPMGEKPQGEQGWSRIRARERRERVQSSASQRTRRRVRLESLQPESLELRQLLATLPAPLKPSQLQNLYDPTTDSYPFQGQQNVYSPTVTIGAASGIVNTNSQLGQTQVTSSPILSVNPLNPDHQVVVAQINNKSGLGPGEQPIQTIGYVTTNGGTSWTQLNLPAARFDPTQLTASPIPDLYVQDISAAIDRNGNIYILQTQINSAGSAGYQELAKYSEEIQMDLQKTTLLGSLHLLRVRTPNTQS